MGAAVRRLKPSRGRDYGLPLRREGSDEQEASAHASRRGVAQGILSAAKAVGWRAGSEDGRAAHTLKLIAEEKTGITADTARRLSKALGTTPQLWLNLQTDYDLPDGPARSARNLARRHRHELPRRDSETAAIVR